MGVQQNLIYCDADTKSIIRFLCEQSNSLYNCGIYWARQIFFKNKRIISKFDPLYEVVTNIHAQAMPSVPAQQTLLSVSEAFKSFKELRQLFKAGELNQSPKPPNYRKSGVPQPDESTFISSFYFFDPNGILLEFAANVRFLGDPVRDLQYQSAT